jgi:hypothetical protein
MYLLQIELNLWHAHTQQRVSDTYLGTKEIVDLNSAAKSLLLAQTNIILSLFAY